MLMYSLDPLRLDVSALVGDPVDIGLIRAHCHVDEQPGTYTDELLLLYMKAAIAWAEGEMHRTIYARSHRWVLRSFPSDEYQEIRLPRGKTQSVDSIQYTSSGGLFTLTGPSASPPGSNFLQDLRSDDGGVVMPLASGSWPGSDLNVPDPVVINFTAGWSTSAVPADITQALLFYVSDAFELRGTADVAGGPTADLREAKISAYRLHRWY